MSAVDNECENCFVKKLKWPIVASRSHVCATERDATMHDARESMWTLRNRTTRRQKKKHRKRRRRSRKKILYSTRSMSRGLENCCLFARSLLVFFSLSSSLYLCCLLLRLPFRSLICCFFFYSCCFLFFCRLWTNDCCVQSTERGHNN